MYLPSNMPVLTDQRLDQQRHARESDARIANMRRTSACGRVNSFNAIVDPNYVAEAMSMGTGLDVATLQQQTEASRASGLLGTDTMTQWQTDTTASGSLTPAQIIANAPQCIPNPRANGGKCHETKIQASVPSFNPAPVMPKRAPVQQGQGAAAVSVPAPVPPHWTNLCWGLRNGAFDPSQFDPTEFLNLQRKCSELNYVGACPPPPQTLAYLTQGRAAKNLPHITASQDILDALPHAPDLGGVPCPESWRQGGLTGYAPPWSDAGVIANDTQQTTNDTGVGSWLMENRWLALALGAGAVFAISRRNGR